MACPCAISFNMFRRILALSSACKGNLQFNKMGEGPGIWVEAGTIYSTLDPLLGKQKLYLTSTLSRLFGVIKKIRNNDYQLKYAGEQQIFFKVGIQRWYQDDLLKHLVYLGALYPIIAGCTISVFHGAEIKDVVKGVGLSFAFVS